MNTRLLSIIVLSVVSSAFSRPSQPTKVFLRSRQLDKSQLNVARSLNPSNIPLLNYFNGTDLEWYGEVNVGTPPQTFTVMFDTGSDVFAIPGKNCTDTCSNQRIFDETISSTYKFIDNGDGLFVQFSTCPGVTNPDFCFMTMQEVSDTVTVGGLTVPAQPFHLIASQSSEFFSDPFDGILGLSPEPQSFLANLISQGLPALYSFYLTPNSIGNAELTLGGIDNSKFSGSLVYSSILPNSVGFWTIPSSGIAVNGKTTAALSASQKVNFDSKTSILVFPTALTEAIYALISPNIHPNPAVPGSYGIPCSQLASLPAVIDFTFTSTAGAPFNLTLPSSELSVGPFAGSSSLCQTVINAADFDFTPIIGGSLLKHYYSTWDIAGNKLGFAKTN